ncbi:MAG: VCBS repeat-containing protein [Candidatus Latescibacteria bacterium]|nr:VCBS repeat-containing protein [Candidatus Latescibacterota bacterium]
MKTIVILLAIGLLACPPFLEAQPLFSDATSSAGAANSLAGSQARLGTNLSWGDYDGDGDLDLYITNWGSSVSPTTSMNRLYQNANGTFSDVASTAGVADNRNSIAAQWVDYDDDGDLDLYVVNFSEQDQLYLNNGDTFSRATAAAGVNVISQGDETAAAWGDYDGDGDLDLYLCKATFRNGLYHNNGNGTFSDVAPSAGVDDIRDSQFAAWGDYDSDGDLDLYVVNREQNNVLYRNNGAGAFSKVACALSVDNTDVGRSASWVDYDNDGDLDLHVVNVGANALYRNDGGNQFTDVAAGELKNRSGAWVSWAGAWGDYDADGLPDVLVANGAEARAGQVSPLLKNAGDGTFTDVTQTAGLSTAGTSAMATGAGDYDGDGDLDLYILNSRFPTFEASQLYRNDTPGSSTIKVRPLRSGAADGIGARVRLLSGTTLVGHQLIASGSGALEAIFGVQTGSSYTVEVIFPDGTTATRSGVAAGASVDIQAP